MKTWTLLDRLVVAAFILVTLYTSASELSPGRASWNTVIALLVLANCYVLVHFIRKYW